MQTVSRQLGDVLKVDSSFICADPRALCVSSESDLYQEVMRCEDGDALSYSVAFVLKDGTKVE
jgi:hypothetical protein